MGNNKGRIILKKIQFNKGSSEYLAFSFIAPLICFLIIEICSYVQLSSDIHEVTSALDVAGRSSTLCNNEDDSKELCQMMAESAISSSEIYNITTNIEYATADDEWSKGTLIKVTIECDIDTISIIQGLLNFGKTTRHIVRSNIYTIEGKNINADEIILLATTIYMEGGSSEESMKAVGTVIMNRVESPLYPNDLNSVIYAPNQFAVTEKQAFSDYTSGKLSLPSDALSTATSVLSGARDDRLCNPNCYEFRTHEYYDENGHHINSANSHPNGIDIGGNWFFW